MSRRESKKRIVLASIILLATVLVVVIFVLLDLQKKKSLEPIETQSQSDMGRIEFNGEKYKVNVNKMSILFMGIDKNEPFEDKCLPGDAGQADCIMILSIDNMTGDMDVLQINRNTMTELDMFTRGGNVSVTKPGQLTLQYAYGTGGTMSSWAMKRTVEELSNNFSLDGYFTLNLAGIEPFVFEFGGINLFIPKNYTFIDSSFKEGETVHMDGALVERYVRYRDTNEFDSVENRMERQVDFTTAFFKEISKKDKTNLKGFYTEYENSYFITNLSASNLEKLGEKSYNIKSVFYLLGETVLGGSGYEEFYVDEEALMNLILELFCTKI